MLSILHALSYVTSRTYFEFAIIICILYMRDRSLVNLLRIHMGDKWENGNLEVGFLILKPVFFASCFL